ncbi:unnamed protein product [Paramecium pentaurelia]|uniref:Uncharacterized protein n=1 Tax=Paramecium pentaurelia TaxID=43138 RepID=A0A8S1V9N4_9CILI|nr:unnamed protein product [Paramecium pentaurelia]
MKIANLLLCLVVIHRIQFEQFKQAVDFDPAFIGILKKNNERFLPYITILKEGEIELQEDHSVLQQAKEKIIQTREFIESLDEGCIQIDSWNFNQIIDQTIDYNPQVQEVWKKEIGCQEEDTDVENPFDGDKVKYKKERKAHKNTHAFAQIKNGSKLSKFKSKISKLMLMATKMQDNQDKNGLKRKQRKIELCDEIIDELIDMILILEKVMNDYIQEVATNLWSNGDQLLGCRFD